MITYKRVQSMSLPLFCRFAQECLWTHTFLPKVPCNSRMRLSLEFLFPFQLLATFRLYPETFILDIASGHYTSCHLSQRFTFYWHICTKSTGIKICTIEGLHQFSEIHFLLYSNSYVQRGSLAPIHPTTMMGCSFSHQDSWQLRVLLLVHYIPLST